MDFEEPKEALPSEESPEPSAGASDPEIATPPGKTESSDPGPPPNGGFLAWLHVVGGFMLFFNTWGIMNAFGVYQTYYESGALFRETSSNISWIGTVQGTLVTLVGILAGPVYDRGYFRGLIAAGAFFLVFGHIMLSLCKSYWQVVLAQGFCIGIGASCLFVPCVSILPSYFSTRLGLAVGLASSGSSVGGIIYPIVLYRLLREIGFAWAVRVMGFIALGTLLVPLTVMRQRIKSQRGRSLIDKDSLKDFAYVLTAIATGIGTNGLTVMTFYISFFPENRGLTNTSMAFYMAAIFNAGSVFGRTLPNALSDKIGPFNIVMPSAVGATLVSFCMLAAKSEAGIIVLALFAGFFSGVFIAMPSVCFAHVTEDKSKLGTRIGMGYFLSAILSLPGGPVAGAILGYTGKLDWAGTWSFGGAMFAISGLVYAVVRVYRSGYRLTVKA